MFDQAMFEDRRPVPPGRAEGDGSRLPVRTTFRTVVGATGQCDEALAHYEGARVLFYALGNLYEEANTPAELGDVHLALGRPDRARDQWRRAADLFRVQHRAKEADILEDKWASMTD
ncbi:tetratricopeptide repeat protein [Streptomyces sp. SudanB182_2057]|uniref:tetratricopeptide repeat protein n=1 Tax=Streptomyces sp. SudanB182_2057 TaxID=3035281 RepID=UPI003F578513